MLFLKRKINDVFGKKLQVPNNDFFSEKYNSEDISKLIRKIKDCFIDKTADNLVENICQRLFRYFWFLPASEGHHHAQEFGLFLHCLDTAVKTIRKFDDTITFEYRENMDIDSFETRKKRVSKQYAFFICGLLHDMGKVAAYKVVAKNGNVWNPCNNLYDFAIANQVSFEDVQHKSDKDLYTLIEKISPFFAARIIAPEDYSYIGANYIPDIMREIGYKKDYAHYFSGLIKEADMESTKEDIEALQPKDDLVSNFIEELKKVLETGRVAINTSGAKAWVFENYTAVHIGILNEIRTLLYSKDLKTPDISVILKRLIERRYVDFVDWKCIYSMDIQTAGKPYTVKVVKFKNSLLWDRSQKKDICKLNVVFNI